MLEIKKILSRAREGGPPVKPVTVAPARESIDHDLMKPLE